MLSLLWLKASLFGIGGDLDIGLAIELELLECFFGLISRVRSVRDLRKFMRLLVAFDCFIQLMPLPEEPLG